MSRHATDHREQDDVSQWDSAQALDGDDNLLVLEQRAERAASRAVIAFIATAAAALVCALAII